MKNNLNLLQLFLFNQERYGSTFAKQILPCEPKEANSGGATGQQEQQGPESSALEGGRCILLPTVMEACLRCISYGHG